jgi:hypothetical protein
MPNFSKDSFGGFVRFQGLAREKRKKIVFQIFEGRSAEKGRARELETARERDRSGIGHTFRYNMIPDSSKQFSAC